MWQRLCTFVLSENWLLTPPVANRQFRIGHDFFNPNKYQPVALLALAAISETGKAELFKPQRIQPLSELEILQFPAPPPGWRYSLAAKQILLPKQSLIPWNLSVDMPLFNPSNEASVKSNQVTCLPPVPVSTALTTIVSENPGATGVAIRNTSKTATLYTWAGETTDPTKFLAPLTPGGYYEVPFGYTGKITGVWNKADDSGSAIVHVFSQV